MNSVKYMKKIIVLLIAVSFILHDMGWAAMCSNQDLRATLAPRSFFNVENSIVKANLVYVIALIERSLVYPVNSDVLAIEAVRKIIRTEGKKMRDQSLFEFGFVRINLTGGYYLYYFDPAKVGVSYFNQPGYEKLEVAEVNNHLSKILIRDVKHVSEQAVPIPRPEISELIDKLDSPSEEIGELARQALRRIGEEPERWEQVVASLRLWEKDNDDAKREVADYKLDNSPSGLLLKASIENLDFIRSIINDPTACSIDRVEKLIKMKSYNIGRRAYLLSGKVSENKVVLYLPDGPLGPLENNNWRCDHTTFPDGPEHFFKIETTTQSAAGKEPEGSAAAAELAEEIEAESNEVATFAYSIEGDAICINQFLVNDFYANHGVATWLFKWLVSDIFAANENADEDKKIKKIRPDWRSLRSIDFLLSIARPIDGKRIIVGPYGPDGYGEFYLPGEFFKSGAVDERMVPDLLIGISKGLIGSLDPNLSIDEALDRVVKEIDTISEASGCARLVIYLPSRDNEMMAAEDKSAQKVRWEPCYQRGLRASGVKNEPLRGEKKLLEMMATNKIEPITIPGVCEFRDGIWLIVNRRKLIECLKEDLRLNKNERKFRKIKQLPRIIREARKLLREDLQEPPIGYGPINGNSVSYSYAIDRYERPLFLFAVVGRLTYAQKKAVTTGFYQSRAAAEKIYELEALRVHGKEIKQIEAVAALSIEGISEDLSAIFHALGPAAMVAPARLAKADRAQGEKAQEADKEMRKIRGTIARIANIVDHFNRQIRDISKLELPEGSERTVTIQGLARAAQSTINIYHLLLMADTMDDAGSIYADHIGGKEDMAEDFADSFATINKYFFEKKRLMTLSDLLNNDEYQKAIINFDSISKDIKKIPGLLRDLRQSLLEWKANNRDIFDRIEPAPGTLNEIQPFTDWMEEWRYDSGAELSQEEKNKMNAAFYINGYLPIFNETIPFADRLIAREIIKSPVDLIDVIKKSISLAKNQALTDGLKIPKIICSHKDPVVEIVTDSEILKSALVADLVKNAIKYNRPEGGDIRVTVEKSGDGKYARISVHDKGVGISDADRREFLFMKESRLERTRSTVAGTGLGLYFARKAALQLGGHIILEESVVGQGSTFTIYLPAGGSETVWPVSQDDIDLFNAKIQRLSHITADLRAALLAERNLVDRTQELNPSQGLFPYWDEFNGLISDLEKAAAIQDRLKEDLEADDLSAAYLDDALRRRIGPLVDPIRMRQVVEHVKAYREGAEIQEGTTDALKEILTTMVRDEMPGYLEYLHNERMLAAESAQPLILISDKLFDEVDAVHLKDFLGPKSWIQVCDPERIAHLSTNKDYSKEKLVCILDRDAYDERWKPDSAQRNMNRATLLVLEKGAFEGTGYLHLEGVAGLALAMAAKKDDRSSADRVMRYIKMLFDPPQRRGGGVMSEAEIRECLKKDTIEFFDQIRLFLKPIEPFKTESLLERYKLIVENYLTAV